VLKSKSQFPTWIDHRLTDQKKKKIVQHSSGVVKNIKDDKKMN
jgi:hypothetical protein